MVVLLGMFVRYGRFWSSGFLHQAHVQQIVPGSTPDGVSDCTVMLPSVRSAYFE
jgi:hypothetical protein